VEDFGVLSASLHDLEDDIGLAWLRDLYCVVFFVVQVDPIFIMRLAHFAGERSPLDRKAEFGLNYVQSLAQPGSEALEVEVAD
jgi:hypothetical protein